jgi:hypothetical protein
MRHGTLALLVGAKRSPILRHWRSFKQVDNLSHAFNMGLNGEEGKESLRVMCDYSPSALATACIGNCLH